MAEWVDLGTERFNEAQRATGLSDERAAREVPVSTRTWIRWRQKGAVPLYSLERVAKILNLEIERPRFDRLVHVDDPEEDLAERMDRLEGLLESLGARVDDGQQLTAESLSRLEAAIASLAEQQPSAAR